MHDNGPRNTSEAPDFSSDQARDIGRRMDEQSADLRRRARAWFAYADALDGAATDSGAAATDVLGTDDRASSLASPRTNKRPLIAHLIGGRPTPAWSPAEVHRTLIEQQLVSPETTTASVRVTLRRMLDGEELARTPGGQYTIPGHQHEGTLQ